MPRPSREVIGTATPRRIYEFGDKIHNKLVAQNQEKKEKYERSGKMSGGKLGKPTLWVVLDLIGVPDADFDPYVLGKFQRGNDVEARAINFLTGIEADKVEPGVVVDAKDEAILTGQFILQAESGYRGGVGYVDLQQVVDPKHINHEIKSSTKMAYDKVAASGRYKGVVDVEKGIGVPYYHHALQLAYYGLGDGAEASFLHYLNADDYRLTTFAINPMDYKEEIDKEIDDIELAFLSKQLPVFEAFLPYHKLKAYWSYKEWNELSPSQMMDKLKSEYPEQYNKFIEMKI